MRFRHGQTPALHSQKGEKWEMDQFPISGQEKIGKKYTFLLVIWACGPGNCRHKALVLQLRCCHHKLTRNCPQFVPTQLLPPAVAPSPLPLPPSSLWVSPNPHREKKKHTQRYPTPKVPAATQILGEEPLQAGISLTTIPKLGQKDVPAIPAANILL